MKRPQNFCIALFLFLIIGFSIEQRMADNCLPPYGMRIHTTARPSLDLATIQADPNLTNGLFASDNQLDPSTTCLFNISTDTHNSTQTSTSIEIEIFNTTNQLILLGEKYQMWDNEASSMQMIISDIQHVKTGYLGNAWPSVYNVARWDFGLEKVEGGEEGIWVLKHGMAHGEWVIAPMIGYDENKWRVYRWNGTVDPSLSRTDVRVEIEIFSLAGLSA